MVGIPDRMRGHPNVPSPVDPDPAPEEIEETFAEMTLQEHLEELRSRLIYASLAVAVGVIGGLVLALPFLRLMATQSGLGELVLISPTEGFSTFMRVALYLGLAFSMPVLIYQIISFLAPGLTRRERQYLFRAIPFVSLMFVFGVLFAFFIVIPRALEFLSGFGSAVFEDSFRASEVLSFYMRLMLWVGVVFELPIVIFIMTRLGIVTADKLASIRKYAFILVLIASALITPTPDPFNMFLVAMPMYALYELGILLSRIGGVRERDAA